MTGKPVQLVVSVNTYDESRYIGKETLPAFENLHSTPRTATHAASKQLQTGAQKTQIYIVALLYS